MSSLTERLREMLREAGGERSALENRRAELAAERDAKLDAIRVEYSEQLAAIDADLTTARRVERALASPEERAKPERQTARPPVTEAPKWRPKDENLRAVLAAIETGHETVTAITGVVDFSRGTVDNAIGTLRNDGFLRLAGSRTAPGSNVKAKVYKLTPAGTEFLNANRTENGAHA